jgi:hypothetical protein
MPPQDDADDKHGGKVTLTVSTLSGDFTHAFKRDDTLDEVVVRTIHKLKLVGDGPWVLEHDGVVLDQTQTVGHAGLQDGAVLTLNPQEGGGGSRGQ